MTSYNMQPLSGGFAQEMDRALHIKDEYRVESTTSAGSRSSSQSSGLSSDVEKQSLEFNIKRGSLAYNYDTSDLHLPGGPEDDRLVPIEETQRMSLLVPAEDDKDEETRAAEEEIAFEDEEYYKHHGQAHLPPIAGTQLWVLIFILCLGLLMASLETSIIGTSLLSIASELGDYGQSGWVVAAYLLTYCGFLIIFARCSDLFGRRSTFMVALVLFTVFSLACGLAQTMQQLIVFRAFQGIGGGGLYSLAMGVATEVPGPVRSLINGLLSIVFAVSSAAGPLIGGAIASNTSWRWVFLMNVPIGAVLIVAAFVYFPKNTLPLNIGMHSLRRIDFFGMVLSIVAIVLLIYAMNEGGVESAWDSVSILVPLCLSGVLFVIFIAWEVYLTKMGDKVTQLPVWPARLFSKRVIASAMLTSLLSGMAFMTIIIYLPQRFQLESGLSPVDAGVRMLAYLVISSFAAGIGAFICVVKNVLWQMLVFSIALQALGLGLMSSLPTAGAVPNQQYAYQAILGMGFGLSLSALPLIGRMSIGRLDHAVNMGAITQIRILGGVIGIGIGEIILQSTVWSDLSTILSADQVNALLGSIDAISGFTPAQQEAVRSSYGSAFNLQMRVMMFITLVCLVVACGTYVKNPVQVNDMDKVEKEERVAKLKAKRAERLRLEREAGVQAADQVQVPRKSYQADERPLFATEKVGQAI